MKKSGAGGTGVLLPKNKRGQEMSTTTIILIILGVIVLVVLVLGFRIGWDKVLPFLPSNNVQNVVTACSSACATGSEYDFCTAERTLKADGLAEADRKGTCYKFATDSDSKYSEFNIETCSTIDCPTPTA